MFWDLTWQVIQIPSLFAVLLLMFSHVHAFGRFGGGVCVCLYILLIHW